MGLQALAFAPAESWRGKVPGGGGESTPAYQSTFMVRVKSKPSRASSGSQEHRGL